MKRLIAVFLFVVGCSAKSQATINIEVQAGVLTNITGTTNVPVGGLLELIATPSGSVSNFAAPTPDSFVSGDNIVVASFAMNYNTGITGVTDNSFPLTLQNTLSPSSSTAFDQGDPLLLRWYPSLTMSSTSPGLGTTYGQFRTDATVDGGNAWITPADGGTATLVLFTQSVGGSQVNSTGYASNVVVPESSSGALILIISIGAACLRRGRRLLRGFNE